MPHSARNKITHITDCKMLRREERSIKSVKFLADEAIFAADRDRDLRKDESDHDRSEVYAGIGALHQHK